MRDAGTDYSTSLHIRASKKHITVPFTEIEDSTRYWDKFGDIQGRLMVDRHNWLLFPVVQKFRGRIIKTIGDSIMAAIAMQQTMAAERQSDETFAIRIRIGIHTGDAIVEKGDVYGDIVNVAARVENISKGNEILVSHAAAYIDDQYAFILKQKGWFVPKGKNKKLYVSTCDRENHPLLIGRSVSSSTVPVSPREKMTLGVFLIATAGVLYFIYLNYLRYLISDSEEVALRYLNLGSILADYSYFAGGAGLVILVLLIIFFRMHTLPPLLTRTIKGGFVFSAGFMLLYLITNYIPISYETRWNEVIDSSTHKFLKVLEDNSSIFSEPSLEGSTLARMPAGHVLLNTGSEEIGSLMWSRVLLGTQRYGWIVHVSPPQMGIPEKKVSSEFRFYFRYKDLYVFITGLICCVGGFWRFRIRPV